jgi:hypothetical protein
MRVDNTEGTGEKTICFWMLSNPSNSSRGPRVCAPTIEGNPERIVYVGRPVEADGKSSACSDAKREQVIIDESTIGLNGPSAGRG